jgi:hypothetical protein
MVLVQLLQLVALVLERLQKVVFSTKSKFLIRLASVGDISIEHSPPVLKFNGLSLVASTAGTGRKKNGNG